MKKEKISNEKVARKRTLLICDHLNPLNKQVQDDLIQILKETEDWVRKKFKF